MLSHLGLMTIYALMISVFFAVLWKRDRAGQFKLFLQVFLGLMGGGLLVAWLMFPFPSGPPTADEGDAAAGEDNASIVLTAPLAG